ncbi:MAG: FecR family protein [Verrucomicrobia bacterium]|nr:FecR family protein [Verrucomicrobiota bacterium]
MNWRRLIPSLIFSFFLGLGGVSVLAAVELKEAEITTVKNIVEHDSGNGPARAKTNETIHEHSKVNTAAASMAELTFGDSTITRMGANTMFSFQSKERLVTLDRGTILINTPPGNGGATVDCGGVTAAVTGTTFLASRDASGKAMFVLLEGSPMKITSGGVTTTIKPGQAASVGIASGETGGVEKGAGPAGTSVGENTGTPEEKPRPVQVFDIDVKKMVESTPLIWDFEKPLPSAEKIQATVEVQQAKVAEGKMESLGVEIVAVKSDGDVLVGSPKPETEAKAVVKEEIKQEAVAKKEEGGLGGQTDTKVASVPDNLDISTAAGGDATPIAVSPTFSAPAQTQPASSPAIVSSPVSLIGQLAGQFSSLSLLPPSSLTLGLAGSLGAVTLDHAAFADMTVTLTGLPVSATGLPASVVIPKGALSATFSADPQVMFPGYALSTDPSLGLASYTVSAVSSSFTATATSGLFVPATIQAANPVRSFINSQSAADLAALDAFFYFTGKATGVTTGPAKFFADSSVGNTRELSARGTSIELYTAQKYDFFAAEKFTAAPGSVTLAAPSGTHTEVVVFANKLEFGTTGGAWTGLSTTTSLLYNYQVNNSSYLPIWSSADGSFVDSFGDFISPFENFPVWSDEGGTLASAVTLNLSGAGTTNFNLAAGTGGFMARGLELNANGAKVEIQTSGDILLRAATIKDVGGSVANGYGFTAEAKGKVQMGAVMGASETTATDQQVRIDASTTGGTPTAGSLAVIRTGDSLEMRNVTIRNFAETKLESVATGRVGRVLLSGSSVRDFKIKELAGAAVNADAKIQMMALDASGNLAGDMTLTGNLPVAAKLASALDSTLTGTLGSKMVDAAQIDLAAKNVTLNNATMVAMNAITIRAQTILVQNSFMTVIRNNGMINMYVREGLVNPTFGGAVVDGRANFAGANTFAIGNNTFDISSQAQLTAAYGTNLLDIANNGGIPQPGKVNVLKL